MDLLLDNFKIVQWVIWIVFALIIWALAVTFVKRKDHAASNEKHKAERDLLAGRVAKIEDTYSKKEAHTELAERVKTVETKVDELPDKTTIHRVESEVKKIEGQLSGIEKMQVHMSNQLDMLVENEIKGSN